MSNLDGLQADTLIAAAEEQTGLSDYGAADFREPLERLCTSLRDEARLNEAGIYTQTLRLTSMIATRMQVEDMFARHPEIADEAIEAPLVIIGLPRTGSTLLQRLIANDRRFTSLTYWESRFPAPFAGEQAGNPKARIQAAREEVAYMLDTVPDLLSIHPLEAEAADEEISLLEQSLYSTSSEAFMRVPGFADWLEQQDQTPGYQYLKKLLQLIQWQKRQRGESGERWILKTPHHLHGIEYLLNTFPGAQIIQTHRDPVTTIPSIASFNLALWKLNCDDPDPKEIGRIWSRKFANGLEHCLEYRDAYPQVSFLDIAFADTASDALAVLNRVYEFIDLPCDRATLESARRFLEENNRDLRPEHRYSAADFGLSDTQLERDFSFYRDRYAEYI